MLYRWLIDERMTVRQILKRLAAGPWRPRCGKRSGPTASCTGSSPTRSTPAPATPTATSFPPRLKPRTDGAEGPTPTCRRNDRARSGSRSRSRRSSTKGVHRTCTCQLARTGSVATRHNTGNFYLLRCPSTCRAWTGHGGASFGGGRGGSGTTSAADGHRGPSRPGPLPAVQMLAKVDELDAAVWGHVNACSTTRPR